MLSAQLLQLCPTLCDPMDHGPPGSSAHGILQARILEWVAISFSSGKVWSEGEGLISKIRAPQAALVVKMQEM